MTKKVLGNDPFATNEPQDPAEAGDSKAARPSKAPGAPSAPGARASKAPPARASKRPSAKSSKRPSKNSEASANTDDVIAPKTARIPIEATSIEAYSEAEQPQASAAPEERPPVMLSIPPSDEDSVGGEGSVGATSAVVEEPVQTRADDEPGLPVDEQIKRLELQLDALLKKKDPKAAEATETVEAVAVREQTPAEKTESDRKEAQRLDDVGELASSEYFARQWGRVAMRDRAEEVDEFGMDREFLHRYEAMIDLLYTKWWRVQTHGIAEVPSDGRVILCANHAGAVPYDGLMLAAALRREHPAKRELRWLADDFVFHFPFMGVALNRLGAVRACQENAERLLRHANVVGVFPEGVKGIAKSIGQRYELQRFGRGGHVKLALRTQTPIVPVAIVGSEETHPLLPTGLLAKLFNVPFLPVTPTFPWFGPLGLVPLPSKWSISFLEPIDVASYGPDAAEDDVLVGRLNEKIRTMIQDELALRTRQRKSVFRG